MRPAPARQQGQRAAGGTVLLLLLLTSCSLWSPPPAPTLRLDRLPDTVSQISLPPAARPHPAPEVVPLRPMVIHEMREDATVWVGPAPVRLLDRGFSSSRAPPGMTVRDAAGHRLSYDHPGARVGTWSLHGHELRLVLAPDETPTALAVHHAAVAALEDARDPALTETAGVAFALRDVHVEGGTRHGALLPAPAAIQWDLTAPAGAVFSARVRLLRPLVVEDTVASDGATVEVWLHRGTETTRLLSQAIPPDLDTTAALDLRVPLAQAGPLSLEVRTLPGENTDVDYVFVERPTVYVPTDHPRRLLVLFVDTLRPDHLGLYGYKTHRTSPRLDAWLAKGRVFERAHSVAPWTLPSARAALSGRPPELWAAGTTVMETLSAAGWTTVGVVANAYLSPRVGMNRGFDVLRYDLSAPARSQVAAALEILADSPDRDVVLMLHLMDPHLPYSEAPADRERWAGPAPEGWPQRFSRTTLLQKLLHGEPPDAATREYLLARYDQNIRAVDDALKPLLAALGEDTPAVFFSDHGEEFWEHGGFEHGHALYEEVVRVPLVVRAPGVWARRIQAPVSLQAVAPTLLALAGLPPGGPTLLDRPVSSAPPLPIGRTLYGRDQWAVLAGDQKWIRRRDGVTQYALATDPGEQAPLESSLAAFSAQFAKTDLPGIQVVWRLDIAGEDKDAGTPGDLEVRHPEGFVATWGPYDPNERLRRPVLQDDGSVLISGAGGRLPGEVYLVPRSPSAVGLSVLRSGRPLPDKADPEALWSSRMLGRTIRIVEDVSLLPQVGDEGIYDPELEEALQLLGYLE